MTPSEYATVFKLLDCYSQNKHKCFLAEFIPDRAKTGWIVCFRPTGTKKDSANRFACRYLRFGWEEIKAAAKGGELPAGVMELLDKELQGLGDLVE